MGCGRKETRDILRKWLREKDIGGYWIRRADSAAPGFKCQVHVTLGK